MQSLHRSLQWLVGHPWVPLSASLVILAVALLAFAGALIPRHAPAIPTTDRYASLEAHRAIRADVRAEPKPPSVLTGAIPGAATPTPTPPPEPVYEEAVARVRIPKIGVDAGISVKGLTAANVMESPNGPSDIAWYSFTAKPGLGTGNAVFSGHVDYINYGPAVLWDLRKLVQGDVIEVALTDGTVIAYAVSGIESYPLNDIPMDQVLAATSTESVTIITCDGANSGGHYANRLVVRATRTSVTPA